MHDEPIDGHDPLPDEEMLNDLLAHMRMEHVTLHLMLDPDCAPIWTMKELGLALRSDAFAQASVAELQVSGLVHRMGEFVFPTQAAIRYRQLAAGA